MTPSSLVRPLNLSRPLIYVSRPLRGLRGGLPDPRTAQAGCPDSAASRPFQVPEVPTQRSHLSLVVSGWSPNQK
jgi:hypothetical protein